jgi:2-polyprenyl-3-methyl-5-hydroxy-6-metoxy-1,4-benzoquinol methylase
LLAAAAKASFHEVMDATNSRGGKDMDRAYWDAVAGDYDSEIFSVLDNDTEGLISGHIARLGGPDKTAADLGCGVGKFTPLLAENFGRVHACDLSSKLLAQARRTCRTFDNVDFFQTDLGRVAHPFDPVDFVLCVNVLIMAGLDARLGALRAVTAQVKSGGHLVLVTPSTESMLYTQFRRIDWCLREGMDCDAAVKDSVPARGSVRELHQGIRPIDAAMRWTCSRLKNSPTHGQPNSPIPRSGWKAPTLGTGSSSPGASKPDHTRKNIRSAAFSTSRNPLGESLP